MGCHFLLQGIFLTQGSNPGLLHSRQILYRLSYKGSLLVCEMSAIVKYFAHSLALPFFGTGMKTDLPHLPVPDELLQDEYTLHQNLDTNLQVQDRTPPLPTHTHTLPVLRPRGPFWKGTGPTKVNALTAQPLGL